VPNAANGQKIFFKSNVGVIPGCAIHRSSRYIYVLAATWVSPFAEVLPLREKRAYGRLFGCRIGGSFSRLITMGDRPAAPRRMLLFSSVYCDGIAMTLSRASVVQMKNPA